MPTGLQRFYGGTDFHFITCSCYQRQPLLGSARRRDVFLRILEQVRRGYGFVVAGYAVMPEHFHLLISEPRRGNPSLVMQVLKQRVARRLLHPSRRRAHGPQASLWDPTPPSAHFWQRRFCDFNVWSRKKHIEKLRYMHRNPVLRGLVSRPELWRWSSYRHYAYAEPGLVRVNADLPPLLRKDGAPTGKVRR